MPHFWPSARRIRPRSHRAPRGLCVDVVRRTQHSRAAASAASSLAVFRRAHEAGDPAEHEPRGLTEPTHGAENMIFGRGPRGRVRGPKLRRRRCPRPVLSSPESTGRNPIGLSPRHQNLGDGPGKKHLGTNARAAQFGRATEIWHSNQCWQLACPTKQCLIAHAGCCASASNARMLAQSRRQWPRSRA